MTDGLSFYLFQTTLIFSSLSSCSAYPIDFHEARTSLALVTKAVLTKSVIGEVPVGSQAFLPTVDNAEHVAMARATVTVVTWSLPKAQLLGFRFKDLC